MIVTELKKYDEIKSKLKKRDKIGIVSCNTCVQLCHTGGEEVMEKLADKLKKDGFEVVDMDLIGVPCDIKQLEQPKFGGNVTIVLACDAGVYNLKKILPKKHRIIPALKTIGLGAVGETGKIKVVKKF